MSASRFVSALGTALVAVLAWCAAPVSAALPCVGADMYIVAHADDTLLFQSPDLLEDVHSNRCVQTIFTTAGDAGENAKYWEGREAGAEAAYAQMAGVPNVWQGSTVSLAGHEFHKETLVGQPGITILYLRLPDGGEEGEGFEPYGFQSLLKLWRSVNGGTPAITEISSNDGADHTYAGLVSTLAVAIQSFGARQILTQNYAQSLPGPDHADHVITGRFVKSAAEALSGGFGGWRLTPYQDYEVSFLPENVFQPLRGLKEAAFAAYAPFDEACKEPGGKECESSTYQSWLRRQYVETSASETRGVVADAGLEQTVGASAPVALNGGGSSSESGGPLAYSWTQVGGPPVALDGADTATPTLVTPPHQTVLTFALTVSQGVLVSAPDFVRVRVPGTSTDPTAVVGPDQSVSAGAQVTLDGSASWDPEGLPLSFSWSQVSGPPVALDNPAASRPSFTAPASSSALGFSLVVSNGTQVSAPATVRVAVTAAPPPPPAAPPPSSPPAGNEPGESSKREGSRREGESTWRQVSPGATASGTLARKRVELPVGRHARRLVRVRGDAVALRCRGRLPVGALCRIDPAGNVLVESRPSLTRAGTFHLQVHFAAGAKPPKRSLKVVIKRARN